MMEIINKKTYETKYLLPHSYIGLYDNKKYSIEDLCELVEQLTCKITTIEEEYKNYRKDVEDNFVRIKLREQINVDWSDFI